LIIDLHTHTTLGSIDSLIKLKELVPIARRCGLARVCITEHGSKKVDTIEERDAAVKKFFPPACFAPFVPDVGSPRTAVKVELGKICLRF